MADNTQYQDNQGDLDVPEQPLVNDFDTPAAPPSDITDTTPLDYPQTDSNVDSHETYDAGQETASGVNAQDGDTPEEEIRIA